MTASSAMKLGKVVIWWRSRWNWEAKMLLRAPVYRRPCRPAPPDLWPQVPPFDERFRGYGLNKVQHALHCAALGFQFRVRSALRTN
jgi:hypothetical protein